MVVGGNGGVSSESGAEDAEVMAHLGGGACAVVEEGKEVLGANVVEVVRPLSIQVG